MKNFSLVTYEGETDKIPGHADTYMLYQEGIYVGYKYYETRYEDYVMGTGNAGESETLTIEVDGDYVASYDAYGAGTYILDAGDYLFTAATDAHNAANNVLAAKGFTPDSTEGRMDRPGNASLVATWNNPELDTTTYATSDAGTEIKNRLDASDPNMNKEVGQEVTYLTRHDWEGTMPSLEKTVKIALNEYLIQALQDQQYETSKETPAAMPTPGADNGLKLVDMIGLAYDDPKWDELLDQLTFEEMVSLIGDAFHWTMPILSVQAPGTRDENGPQGLTVALFGSHLGVETTALTSEDVLAATFNTDLVYEIGNIVGNDCLDAKVTFLYGPGANTHRTPYGGRNFEYYSEDAVLSSEIGEAEVKGIEEKGILNEEWQCNGLQITDNVLNSMVNGIDGVMGGTTAYDSMLAFMITGNGGLAGYENDPVAVKAMREACHHNLYAIANSQAMNGIGPDTTIVETQPIVITICTILCCGFWFLFTLSLVFWILKQRKFRKTEEYTSYKEFKTSLKSK